MGPTLRLERKFWDAGDQVVVGIDEVGRGAWAGPVTVAAVVPAPEHVRGVRDSKQLTRAEREKAARAVRRWAHGVGVGHSSYQECDEWGMTEALRVAAMRALAELDAQGFIPDRIVLDGNHDYLRMPSKVTTVIKGDTKCLAVAAASCVAKVTRDRHDERGGGALPAVRLRVERRLPRTRAQARARGLRPERHPPSVVDLHGVALLAGRARLHRDACSSSVRWHPDGQARPGGARHGRRPSRGARPSARPRPPFGGGRR